MTLAWLCLRFYDLPVRSWLGKRYMGRQEQTATTAMLAEKAAG